MLAVQPTKTCSKCGKTKPVTEFSRDRRKRDGLRVWCKLCSSEEARRYRETPTGAEMLCRYKQRPEYKESQRLAQRLYRQTPEGQKNIRQQHLSKKGMAPDEYEALFMLQGGVCARCRNPETYRNWRGTLHHLSVFCDPITQDVQLLCHACLTSVLSIRRSFEDKQYVLEQLAKLPHIAWIAASSQDQNHDARQFLEMIANGRLSDLTTIRLAARGFFIKHPSSSD